MPSRASLLRVFCRTLALLALLSAGSAAEEAGEEAGGGVRVAQAAEPEAPAPETAPSAPPESGGDDIEEIVVLGAESDAGQDFGAADSVTGFGAEDLAALGAQSIADLASFTPNLEIVTSGATTPTFFIRGVGLNDFNPNSTGAVAVYQDDVAINAPAIQLGTLFDVEGVNVLRGPQGTGIARNSSAGAIKIYARKPTGEFGGYLRSDFGDFEFRDYEGAVEAPIFEDYVAGRLAFRLTTRDGTVKNGCGAAAARGDRTPWPGGTADRSVGPWSICGEPVTTADTGGISSIPTGLPTDVNDMNNWAARGTLLFQPTLDSTFYLNAHGGKRDELSRLGQAIGTFGNFCHDPTVVCQNPSRGVPPAQFDRNNASEGLLGFPQGEDLFNNGYIPPETRALWLSVLPCLVDNASGCERGGATFEERLARNRLKVAIANRLAENLDPKPWTGQYNHAGPTTNDVWGGYLKGEVVLGGGIELKTTSGIDSYDRLIDIDLDFSPETLFHIKTQDEGRQFYQDLTLTGELGETGVEWQLGGWYLHEDLDVNVNNDFGRGIGATLGVRERDYTQETDSAAGFGYMSFDFLQDFTLDGGYRFNWETKAFEMDIFGAIPSPSAAPGCDRVGGAPDHARCIRDEEWMASTGTIRLTYRFREDTHVTWRYTRGYKPGSINATASQFSGPTVADPEELDAFEFGLHGSWLDGMLRVDASLFYYDYTDYQIFIAQQFFGGTPEFVLLNANNAEVYGSEIDAVIRPWLGAFVQVRFSWLETQFLDFVRRDQFIIPGEGIISRETQFSGNRLLNSPRFKVSLTGEQTFPLGRYGSFSLRYDGVWTDITYYDASEGVGLGDVFGRTFLPDTTIAQVPFWLHNLRATWRAPTGGFEVALWVRNLTDEAYKTFAFDGSNFQKTTIYFVSDPRTVGLSAAVNF